MVRLLSKLASLLYGDASHNVGNVGVNCLNDLKLNIATWYQGWVDL